MSTPYVLQVGYVQSMHLLLSWNLIIQMFSLIIFRAYGSGKEDSPLCDVPGFENCRMKLLRHVSFVDCPVRLLRYDV